MDADLDRRFMDYDELRKERDHFRREYARLEAEKAGAGRTGRTGIFLDFGDVFAYSLIFWLTPVFLGLLFILSLAFFGISFMGLFR